MRTKLAVYLARTKESHRVLAARAGVPHQHPMISQWANAYETRRFPGLDAAEGIEAATGGEVPAVYWRALKNRLDRRLVRRRGSPQNPPKSAA